MDPQARDSLSLLIEILTSRGAEAQKNVGALLELLTSHGVVDFEGFGIRLHFKVPPGRDVTPGPSPRVEASPAIAAPSPAVEGMAFAPTTMEELRSVLPRSQ